MICIISNIEDFNYLTNKYIDIKIQFYAENYNLYIKLKKNNAKYLYDYISFDPEYKSYKLNKDIVLNWYRDKKGLDVFFKNNLSISQILSRRIFFNFANDFRNYKCITEILKNNDRIFISKNTSSSLKRIQKIYKNKINFFEDNTNNDDKLNNYNSIERALFYRPKINIKHKVLSFIQLFFLKFFQNKILCESDWSSKDFFINRKDILLSNSIFFFKSYYNIINKKYLILYQNILPIKIDKNELSKLYFFEKNSKNKNSILNKDLSKLLIISIEEEYRNNRNKIIETCALYHSIFNYYKPRSLIISGLTAFSNIIAVQIAKINNIETQLCVDGYLVYYHSFDWFKDQHNKKLLFDKYFSFGDAMKDIYTDKLNLNKNQIINTSFPHLDLHKRDLNKNIKNINKYDSMIFAYSPTIINPNILWDSQIFIESDIIYTLNKLNFKKIAIKFKTGLKISSQQIRSYKNYYDIIKEKYNYEIDIEIDFIFSKELYEVVDCSNFIIGSLTSGVIESLYRNVPYIIYEPPINGNFDESFIDSKIFNTDTIARDIKKLEFMIENKKQSVICNKKYAIKD